MGFYNTNGINLDNYTTAQRNALSNLFPGTTIYNSDFNSIEYYNGTAFNTLVSTYSGTTNRIDVTKVDNQLTINISANYIGQTSITTLGTITSGTWNATVISTTYTQAQVISVSGTTNQITVTGTTNPTIALAPIITAGSIGSGSAIPTITYDQFGRITATSSTAVSTLSAIIAAGSVGSTTAIPVITYDQFGRITATTTASTSVQFRNGANVLGTNVKMAIVNVTSAANSTFTADITAFGFTTIYGVYTQGILNTTNVSDQPLTSVNTITTTTITGRVTESANTGVLIGGTIEGLEFAGAGITVSVLVIGI